MKWKFKDRAPKELFDKHSDLDSLLVQLLYNRDLTEKEKINRFLNPDYDTDAHDPFLMKDIKKATERIKQAHQNEQKVAIFGDYDADGVCAATLLNQILSEINLNPEVYIPDREKEGYGLSTKGIDYLDKKGIELIITVDCGISDQKQIKYAQKKGMEVIVTDHHLIPDHPPQCSAIVNPQQKHCDYPYPYLSGTGVVFKLSQALIKEIEQAFFNGYEKWFLDLVALATVADLMPLTDENRTLVKYGIGEVLPKTKSEGIKALMDQAGIDPSSDELTVSTLAFILGPRLNAAGRMDHANLAYELLNTEEAEKAKNLAHELEKKNRKRQNEQRKISKQLQDKLEKKGEINLIFEGSEKWPPGLVGLASGKITDRYYRPSCIYHEGPKKCKGSCRSVKGVNIVDLLSQCEQYLEEYGGHEQAAGFTVKKDKLPAFKKCLQKIYDRKVDQKELEPEIEIDAEAPAERLNVALEKIMNNMAPFGKGNPQPVFLARNLKVTDKRKVGSNNNHLKLSLKADLDNHYRHVKAIYFNWESEKQPEDKIKQDKKYNFVFKPLIDEWKGRKSLTLKIIDFRACTTEKNKQKSGQNKTSSESRQTELLN